MTDPASAVASQLRNITAATGRNTDDWYRLVVDTGLTKHGEILAYLKREHGLTHGNANALTHHIRQRATGGPKPAEDLLDAQYAGRKAALRPIHDELVTIARALGDDVTVTVNKTSVSLRRAKQFALIQAPSASRVELGLNLRDVTPTPRLHPTTGMCTHHITLTEPADIDDETARWLQAAYEQGTSDRHAEPES
ncbi:MAG: DUF4287 domain-containing protein [Pseudonocardiaceae bacterium]|nr:DUF4287 domain-containing protein [Pseudonocardiaceae bacterium]